MDLYQEEVMDHYEHPRNQGELDGDDVLTARDSNASCGDMIQFFIRTREVPNTRVPQGSELVITDVKWKGIGCAITTAAASKLSEYLQGQALRDLRKMSEEDLLKKGIGFEVNPGRMKCLTLPVRVVSKLLS
jgi:nitrogen fixation NifU-like protein